MRTIGELKKAIEDKPDDMPLSLTFMEDSGEFTSIRIADAWVAQGVYAVEFERRVTEVPNA